MHKEGAWLQEEDFESRIRSSRNIDRPLFLEFLAFVTRFTGVTYRPIARMSGWEWTGLPRLTQGWTLPLQTWRALTGKGAVDQAYLNRRWGCVQSRADWNQFWNNLWQGKTHPRTKFVVWQLMQHGYYTNTRGAVWGVCREVCPVCEIAPETTAHLFFECAEVKHRWIKAIRLLRASKMSFGRVNSAFDIVSVAVCKHVTNPALLVLMEELVWCTWVERNKRAFQGNTSRMPLQVVFKNSAAKLETLAVSTGNKRRLAVLQENKNFLLRCAQFMSTVSIVM